MKSMAVMQHCIIPNPPTMTHRIYHTKWKSDNNYVPHVSRFVLCRQSGKALPIYYTAPSIRVLQVGRVPRLRDPTITKNGVYTMVVSFLSSRYSYKNGSYIEGALLNKVLDAPPKCQSTLSLVRETQKETAR